MKRARVTSITDRDGFYLTDLLLRKGYEVHGLARAGSDTGASETARLSARHADYLPIRFPLADLRNPGSLTDLLRKSEPDEVYHLAGQTRVGPSLARPWYTAHVVALGTLHLLVALRSAPRLVRFFYAASSEMFGEPDYSPQDESTPFRPETPYPAAKLYAFWMVRIYRQAHGLFACSGILYNHESPHRRPGFVTTRIARSAAAIATDRARTLRPRNLEARRTRDSRATLWKASTRCGKLPNPMTISWPLARLTPCANFAR
jgi:GDPmannose 4,6-dehydratase